MAILNTSRLPFWRSSTSFFFLTIYPLPLCQHRPLNFATDDMKNPVIIFPNAMGIYDIGCLRFGFLCHTGSFDKLTTPCAYLYDETSYFAPKRFHNGNPSLYHVRCQLIERDATNTDHWYINNEVPVIGVANARYYLIPSSWTVRRRPSSKELAGKRDRQWATAGHDDNGIVNRIDGAVAFS